MFCDVTTATSHRNKFPKLKGRAAEIREVIPCLPDVWNEVANMECAHHIQVRTLLQCSCEMERIVDAHKNEYVWPTDVAAQFKTCGFAYNTLMSALCKAYGRRGLQSMKLFNVVPKTHYLAHICLVSQYINPRLAWCYMGEDFMQRIRKVAGGCMRGCNPVIAGQRTISSYRTGFAFHLSKLE